MIYATAGAKLYIGGAHSMKSADHVEADFSTETWVEITGLESLGSLGDSSSEITQAFIDSKRAKRIKGVRNAGSMEVICGINYADDGQQALIAAEKASDDYAFRIVFDDAPANGTPSERMFIAAVGSAVEAYDAADTVMKLNASLWVNSNVVRVDAAAGV